MKFSIVTPSFCNSQWLKLCIASVSDQGVPVEHIVQDACSNDGTLEWLCQDSRVKAFVEKDSGMYDAINRGLRKSSGDILAYLNCDEQYLPGSLRAVEEYFLAHPETDILFADSVIVDPKGDYICSRQVQLPQKFHTWTVHLSTLTCATFFRRRVIDDCKLFFDANFRYVGDAQWVLEALNRKIKMGTLRYFTSVFTQTGANISLHAKSEDEKLRFYRTAPKWVYALRPLWIAHHRARRLFGGVYFQRPFKYALYTDESPMKRLEYQVDNPTFRWKSWQ